MRTPTTLTKLALAGVAGLALTFAGPAMGAQNEYIDQASRAGSATPGTIAADDILFPALMDMDEPPMPVGLGSGIDALLMLAPGDPEWSRLERWAQRDPQQAVVEAIKEIADPDARNPVIFNIPFGYDDTDPVRQDAGLWIEVPTDGLLASAKYHYLDKIEWANALMLFEGMRLAEQGEGDASMDVLVSNVRLGRVLAERPGLDEVRAAYAIMRLSSERVRDVVYTYTDSFTVARLVEAAEAFDSRRLRPRLMPMPGIPKLSAQQLLARTFDQRAGVKPGTFAQTFALLESGDRPLRRLSEAARFRDSARFQGDYFTQHDWLDYIFGDFAARWKVPGWQDPLLDKATRFQQADSRSVALVKYAAEGLTDLRQTRTALEVDLGGTMNALGVVCFHKDQNTYPPSLAATEPIYVNKLFDDPYHPRARYGYANLFHDLIYWVPMRDQKWDRRQTPHPHAVEVVLPGEGESMFSADAPKSGSADAMLRSLSDNKPAFRQLIGQPASRFNLTNWHNTETPITLDNTQGQIRVMIFWATWCGPCKASIPTNNEVYNKFKGQGVTVFSVCDNNRGGSSMARTADQHNMAYPTGLDQDGAVKKAYNLAYFPYTVIIDRAGVIRAAGVRADNLDKALTALVAEQPMGWDGGGSVASAPFPTDFDLSDLDGLDFDPSDLDGIDLDQIMADAMSSPLATMSPAEIEALTLNEFWDLMGMEVPQAARDEFGSMNMAEFGQQMMENPGDNPLAAYMDPMGNPVGAARPNQPEAETFTVLLDDSTFLLYSTGPNGTDNRAKKVGAGGDDVLLWPPLMSLTREHARGGM